MLKDAGKAVGLVNSNKPITSTPQWLDDTRFSNQTELTAADICTQALKIDVSLTQKDKFCVRFL